MAACNAGRVSEVCLENIRKAHERVRKFVHRTPVLSCSAMATQLMGETQQHLEIFLKCENLQRIGAFKIRGALNAASLSSANVVVTHSSGNHAQALALAAKILGKKAVVVMPSDSPKVKVCAVRDTYGADVRFCEPILAAREEGVAKVIEEFKGQEVEMIHPYNDPRVCCGQGTLGLELMEDCPELDAVVIAVGGGGLLAGNVIAIKGLSPSTLVIAAEPVNVNDCYRSFQAKSFLRNEKDPKTIADSVKTDMGDLTWPIIRDNVDAVIQVSEDDIKKAMRLTFERAKLVIEPGAAVAVAAAALSDDMRKLVKEKNLKKVAVVLCGGNLDIENIQNLIL